MNKADRNLTDTDERAVTGNSGQRLKQSHRIKGLANEAAQTENKPTDTIVKEEEGGGSGV